MGLILWVKLKCSLTLTTISSVARLLELPPTRERIEHKIP